MSLFALSPPPWFIRNDLATGSCRTGALKLSDPLSLPSLVLHREQGLSGRFEWRVDALANNSYTGIRDSAFALRAT